MPQFIISHKPSIGIRATLAQPNILSSGFTFLLLLFSSRWKIVYNLKALWFKILF